VGRERPPLTLVIGMLLVVGLAVAEAVHVAGRDDLRTPVRVMLVFGIGLQLPFAALALRRSSAAVMVLLLCAVTALGASIAGGHVVPAVAAFGVLVLVAVSLRWFPTAEPWSS
jgi:hypothetical protein